MSWWGLLWNQLLSAHVGWIVSWVWNCGLTELTLCSISQNTCTTSCTIRSLYVPVSVVHDWAFPINYANVPFPHGGLYRMFIILWPNWVLTHIRNWQKKNWHANWHTLGIGKGLTNQYVPQYMSHDTACATIACCSQQNGLKMYNRVRNATYCKEHNKIKSVLYNKSGDTATKLLLWFIKTELAKFNTM